MLKKLSIALSLAAVLGLGLAISVPDPVFAKKPNQSQKNSSSKNSNKNVKFKNVKVKNFKNQKWVSGKKYGNNYYFGHHRHRWHGQWYDYGVGPCWINIEGEWFWNVLACPL